MKALLSKSAGLALVMGIGLLGGLLGDVLVSARFGLGSQTDGLFLALTVPQLLMAVTATAVDQVFVPVFSRLLDDRRRFNAVLGILMTWGAVIATLVCGVLVISAHVWMNWLALASPDSVRGVAVSLLPLFGAMLWLSVLNSIMGAALRAQGRFNIPAAERALQGLGIVTCLLLFAGQWGILSVAAGYLVGSSVQCLWLITRLSRAGYRPQPSLRGLEQDGFRFAEGIAMTFGSSLLRNAYVFVERIVASSFPVGSISALALASRLIKAVILLSDNSLSTVVFPQMSATSHRPEGGHMGTVIRRAIFVLSAVNVPIVIGLLLLRLSLARVLYQYGSMSAAGVGVIAGLIGLYSVAVLTTGWEQVMISANFAVLDYRLGSKYIAVFSIVHVLADLILAWRFGIYGLALATTVVSVTSAIGAWLLLQRHAWLKPMEVGRISLQIAPAACVMAAALWGVNRAFGGDALPASVAVSQRLIALIAPTVVGVLGYVLTLALTQRTVLAPIILDVRAALATRFPHGR